MSPEIEYYDPVSEIRANYTPPLQATKPKYEVENTPPPLVLEDTSESSAGSGRSRLRPGKRRPGRTRPSQCDAVLIGLLDPNRPDISTHAGQHPLESASQSEAGDGDSDEGEGNDFDEDPMTDVATGDDAARETRHNVLLASKALELQIGGIKEDVDMIDRPESPRDDGKGNEERPEHPQDDSRPSTAAADHTSSRPKVSLDLKPPPRPPQIDTFRGSKSVHGDEDEPLVSPALAKFAITQGNPANVLPAMQSPPRSSSAHSPEASGTTLPSLQTALSQMSETSSNGVSYPPGTNGHSPSMTRPSPSHMPGYGPSPASYTHPSPGPNGMSPPGMPPNRNGGYWSHPPLREGSQSTTTPSEYTSNHSQSTPSSALTAPSPANSYHAPISAHQRQDSDGTPHAGGTSPTINGNGSLATHAFKCTWSGCTAAPFQTQYLLNSHANVHSSSRPHFCPVEGCNRGPGGKGFKRKNEMIRHGLVHESPGYQCPFCPDQTHKYPRPDNLQRHVRVHHVDKDRDDPLLRQVLAQRPEGPNRGRRRRI